MSLPARYAQITAGVDQMIGCRIIDRIMHEVAARHLVCVAEMVGPWRDRRISRARQEAMWLAYQVRRADGKRLYSLPFIGQRFNRDHTTVLLSLRQHEKRMGAQQVAA